MADIITQNHDLYLLFKQFAKIRAFKLTDKNYGF